MRTVAIEKKWWRSKIRACCKARNHSGVIFAGEGSRAGRMCPVRMSPAILFGRLEEVIGLFNGCQEYFTVIRWGFTIIGVCLGTSTCCVVRPMTVVSVLRLLKLLFGGQK